MPETLFKADQADHNAQFQDNCVFFYHDADLETKTPEGNGMKVVPNSAFQLILPLILKIHSTFISN